MRSRAAISHLVDATARDRPTSRDYGTRVGLHYLLNSNMELITITKLESKHENGHGIARPHGINMVYALVDALVEIT